MQKIPLSSFKKHQKGIVVSIENNQVQVAFLEMGILPGVEIELTHIAPLGDPISININNYQLSLRKSEAAFIMMHLLP
jgi:ferrous iron transport protein A